MCKNFYAIRRMENSLKDYIIKNIINDNYNDVKDLLNKLTKPVHIGKYEEGWKFLFDWNYNRFYELNRKSINNFLSDDMIIVDNDNNHINLENFWELVDKSSDGIDNQIYFTRKLSDIDISFLLAEEFPPHELKKYNPKYYEFYSDNLRFSTEVDFK